jgi:hypothetical protein
MKGRAHLSRSAPSAPFTKRRAYRPLLEILEDRCLLTGDLLVQPIEALAIAQTEAALVQDFSASFAPADTMELDFAAEGLMFTANDTTDGSASFELQTERYGLTLAAGAEAIVQLPGNDLLADEQLAIALVGASPDAQGAGVGGDVLNNALVSSSATATSASDNSSAYGQVWYANVYNGIDELFYNATNYSVTFDFFVQSGSDPSQIVFSYEGAQSPELDAEGNLLINMLAAMPANRSGCISRDRW